MLSYLLLLGFSLKFIIEDSLRKENTIVFLNSLLVFFFLFEWIYRFMFQKLPVIELENFLHLPISKSSIIHYLLARSFISLFSIIAFLLFTPFAIMEVAIVHDSAAALYWLATIILISWALHWAMLWYKQKFGDSIIGIIVVFAVLGIALASAYYGWFNIGEIFSPVFASSLQSPVPVLVMMVLVFCSYYLVFNYYRGHAYVEDLAEEENIQFANRSIGFFSRFGLAGEMANLEWKLIIRHKKSRGYLFLAGLLLFYGLLFYGDSSLSGDGYSSLSIIFGVIITGSFIMQYGQLFLSWNSAYFDFFLSKKNGARELVKGKHLLFIAISVLSFLLTVPYVYYGWDILFTHLATFLFNIGITIHLLTYMALWKPKPMDISKGAMFNYEGVGVAQFLMMIPMIIIPYLIYLPFALIFSWQIGLFALGACGILGIIFFKKLTQLAVKRILNNRYEISSSFRQEL